ncbi:MAG: hypothetical protein FGM33_02415 [Candidatus Kapabacteria bacterium]|nr:hypothetical protein [Candidatus Kapabacteria bacterium]
MIHRLILMLSALFLMFAVFGFVFSYGAYRGDNVDVGMGNLVMGLVMIGAAVATLLTGLRLQKKFDARVEAAIASLSGSTGSFEAQQFATTLNISVDDARDVLGKLARAGNWNYEELGSYNARYFVR